jgi:hypothetical protein
MTSEEFWSYVFDVPYNFFKPILPLIISLLLIFVASKVTHWIIFIIYLNKKFLIEHDELEGVEEAVQRVCAEYYFYLRHKPIFFKKKHQEHLIEAKVKMDNSMSGIDNSNTVFNRGAKASASKDYFVRRSENYIEKHDIDHELYVAKKREKISKSRIDIAKNYVEYDDLFTETVRKKTMNYLSAVKGALDSNKQFYLLKIVENIYRNFSGMNITPAQAWVLIKCVDPNSNLSDLFEDQSQVNFTLQDMINKTEKARAETNKINNEADVLNQRVIEEQLKNQARRMRNEQNRRNMGFN